MTLNLSLRKIGVLDLKGLDRPYSDPEMNNLIKLCDKLTIVPGTGEDNRALCARIVIDPVDLALEDRGGDDRKILDLEVAASIVDVLMNDRAKEFWKSMFDVNHIVLRRAQVHILRDGDYIGYHTDDQANPDYIANVVIGLSSEYGGGEYVTYMSGNKVPHKTQLGTILVSLNGVPHEVAAVTSGERKTLAFFFAENEHADATMA